MTKKQAAIAGLGITDVGKVYGRTSQQFAAEAVRKATADAGLQLSDIDGLIFSNGVGTQLDPRFQMDLGLKDLKLLTHMQAYGSTAALMVGYAAMAIESGMAETIAIVWADDALREKGGSSDAYKAAAQAPSGWTGLTGSNGLYSQNTYYSLAARRHMHEFGTTNDHFGSIAVAQREWAQLNPLAYFNGKPMTLEDYHASRWIAEPFHLFDCCLVSNGAVGLIVTSLDRARSLPQPPVPVLGWAQAHPGYAGVRDERFGLVSGAAESGPRALKMANTSIDEIDVFEIYDCYTYTVLITLEDYGVLPKGEGGRALAEPGMIGPGGKLKVNTGGGELSAFYLWGMTPLYEAVVQARGQGGARQVDQHDRVMVSGNGGTLDYHGTLVLGTDR